MIILFVLVPLTLLLVLVAGVCAFHWAVGNGRFEALDCSSWDGLFGAQQSEAKQRDDD